MTSVQVVTGRFRRETGGTLYEKRDSAQLTGGVEFQERIVWSKALTAWKSVYFSNAVMLTGGREFCFLQRMDKKQSCFG